MSKNINEFVAEKVTKYIDGDYKQRVLEEILSKIRQDTDHSFYPCDICKRIIDDTTDMYENSEKFVCEECAYEFKTSHPDIKFPFNSPLKLMLLQTSYKDYETFFSRNDMAMTCHPYCVIVDNTNMEYLLMNRHYNPVGIDKGAQEVAFNICHNDKRIFFYRNDCIPWKTYSNFKKYIKKLSKFRTDHHNYRKIN